MDGELAALIAVFEADLKTKGDMVLTRSGFISSARKALDSEAAVSDGPAPVPQLPQPPPEFPKLKVKYDQSGNPVEHIICATIYDEVPFMSGGWYTRPLT